MAILQRQGDSENDRLLDDGADHLRADILGSIVGSDPRLPNYLGRINNLITAHGAVGNNAATMMKSPRPETDTESSMASPSPAMAVPGGDPGAVSRPPTPTATPDTSPPLMRSGGQQPSLLGRIGRVAARMGNIAGDILAPGITANIPGTDLYRAAKAQRAEATSERQQKLATEEERAAADTSRAATEAEKEKREARAAGQPKPKEEQWSVLPEYTGPNGEPVEVEKNSGEMRVGGQSVPGIKRVEKPGTAEQDTQRATQLRADLAQGKKLSPGDAAWLKGHTEEKTTGPFAAAAAQAPEKGSERADRSYQFNSGQLEKIRTPIDAMATRMSNLVSNVNFRTPQADSLLAPELLSIQAGGAGSGLRMNDAEISRIIGGATKWTQLQTALNKWSTNPSQASFTNEQRNQMRQIIQASAAKLSAKQAILEQGEQELLDADDVKTHRQILANTRKFLDAVDAGKKVVRKDGKIQIGE